MNYNKPLMVTFNKKIAVEPFPDMSVKTTAQGQGTVKVARIENKVGLTRLRVLFPTEDGRFLPGQTVLVRSDLFLQPWAKERHQLGDLNKTEFILLPEGNVEAVIP